MAKTHKGGAAVLLPTSQQNTTWAAGSQLKAELSTISSTISSINLLLLQQKHFAFVVNGRAEMYLIDLA